ncbi:MAG TPA: prolyl oligopeptidase family serine peptidase [Candidatus Xenobia bacterium]|nr:prolyl oligopeptidase family serine peptidase [Candidatus Xenobia bacterium]
MKRQVLLALLCALLLLGWAAADEKKPEWTAEDILLAESAGQFRISPDGRWAVWVRTAMDKEKGERVSNLWLSSLTENKELQLTRGNFTHSAPRWSPDGALISFLSTRPLPESVKKQDLSKSQLWLLNPAGGEPWHLTEFERGIRAYAWKDKDTIVFAAQEDPTLYEQRIKEKKDTSQVVEDAPHEPPVRLFRLSVKDKKVKRLTANDDWIDMLEASPDGHWAATRHQRSLSYEFDQRVPPVTFLTNLDTGEQKQVFADGRIIPTEIEWARDSKGFYVVSDYSRHPRYRTAVISLLYYLDVARGTPTQVNLEWERGLGAEVDRLQATPDGVLALLADGVRYKPARYTRSDGAWTRSDLEGEHVRNLFGWALSQDGKMLVYNHSTPGKPTQWYRARLDATRIVDADPLTQLNPNFKDKPTHRSEIVRWKGARDEEVEGILYYPLNYEAGKRYPLILSIHGGPASMDLDAWEQSYAYPKILLAQKGALVLEVNYHGSANYGLDWVESIGGGNYYDLEIPDLEAGVDYLIARGLADPDKLATMGWSNGSILSIELVVRNPRYKAAAVGAGDVEWFSDWANVDFGAAFDNYYLGAAPYENPEIYLRKSPVFRMKNVKTPTLIFFGTEDRNVPTGQGWTHFRTLQQIGQTEVRFILFPGEPHGLRKFVHQRRKVEEEQVWFDRHLFATYKAPNEAFKEGSPLDVALKRGTIQKVGTQYGVLSNGRLIPEVVEHKELELGRFEVTRAQFAAFDPKYKVEPGTENFPANGIPFEQAQAYCAWLAKLTGQLYRVANEDEVKEVYEGASGNENTLDFWAGYSLNPDDAERLMKKVGELAGAAPLLREVGLFQGRGEEELVFDLGGNVAEWVIGRDGKGKLLGGSADRAADPKAAPRDAAEGYRGFRVLRGEPKKKEEKKEK